MHRRSCTKSRKFAPLSFSSCRVFVITMRTRTELCRQSRLCVRTVIYGHVHVTANHHSVSLVVILNMNTIQNLICRDSELFGDDWNIVVVLSLGSGILGCRAR